MAEAIKTIGAEHCILSSDLGVFDHTPQPIEGMRFFIASLLRKGITPDEIECMVKLNPAVLLDLA